MKKIGLYFKNLANNFESFKIIILLFLLFSLFLLKISFAQQTKNDLIISWQASSFVPYYFEGKILPTVGSNVFAAIDLIQNNKIVDLSKTKIYWYVNNELFSNSIGIQKIKFSAPPPANSNINLRVELPDLGISKTIEIPVVKPKLVLDAPFPKKEIKTNYFELVAYPYFFNLTNNDLDYLSVSWLINGVVGKPSAENPLKIKINITDKNVSDLVIEVFAQNTELSMEGASKKVDLVFVK